MDGLSFHNDRKYWLDIARVLAIISISCNHAIHRAFLDTMGGVSIADNIFRSFIQVFSRLGVPLFLMITGALLLNKRMDSREDINRFYSHNFLGILITSEIWYCIMFWFRTLGGANDFLQRGVGYTLLRFLGTLLFINQETMDSMWYMPMILCVYLIIPWANMAVHRLNKHYIGVAITVVLLSSMIFPNINEYLIMCGLNTQLDYSLETSNLFSMYLVYVLLGFYMGNGALKRVPSLIIILVGVISFAFSGGYQVIRYVKYNVGDIKYNFILIAISAVMLFELIRRLSKDKHNRAVQYISKISFGIYFIHIIIMTLLYKLPFMSMFGYTSRFFIYEILSVGMSIVVIFFTAKVDFLKRYLYMIK